MKGKYRVRFSAKRLSLDPGLHIDAATDPSLARARTHRKSHHGCLQCKARRVKCDETFPVCKRCQARGAACTLTPTLSSWRPEKPWLPSQISALPSTCSTATDKKLLQWWFETASNILVLDPNSNPLSLPILEHLAISPALCMTVQSLSAGHKCYFDTRVQVEFLEKRSTALSLCREELKSSAVPLTTVFFTVLLLGISTSWMHNTPDDYGKEHLIGARAILDILLAQEDLSRNPTIGPILAYYMWWDMSCSFLVSSQELPPLDTPSILISMNNGQGPGNRFAGCMVEIYHLLGLLLRYCKKIVQSGPRDHIYEEWLEQELLKWQPSQFKGEEALLAEAFQKHGLIILYRACGARSPCNPRGSRLDEQLTCKIYQYAKDIVSKVLPHQITRPYLETLSTPLLTAGAELTIRDQELRNRVRQALSLIYASVRTSSMLWEKDLLEELWAIRDSGIEVSYMDLMLQKKWNLTLA